MRGVSAPRVLALGGSGLVGRYAVRTLLSLAPDAELTIADRDIAAADAFARELGGSVRSVEVDVTDAERLAAVLGESDVVVNTVGPYFRFGVPILRASLEAGCHYLDVCDDPEPTVAMLDLDELARQREVSAVIGLGISPGVTNLLAAHALSALDEVVEVITGWSIDSAKPEAIGPEPSAAIVHAIEQLTGVIRVRRDGAFVQERPVRAVLVDYPGAGRARCWTIGHPEPVTLPRTFPQIRDSVNVMSTDWGTAGAIRLLGKLIDSGLVAERTAARWVERVEGASSGDIDADAVMRDLAAGKRALPPVFALARGTHGAEDARVGATITSTPPGGMGGATGLPLGVGVALLLEGIIDARGVHAPESAVDPAGFFAKLAPLCAPPREGMDDLVRVTRSWTVG